MLPIPLKKFLPPLTVLTLLRTVDRDLYVRESDLLAQDAFRELLSFERKRCERTNRTICAVLLDIAGIDDAGVRAAVTRHIARTAAGSAHRPVTGWYEHDRVIGIIMSSDGELGSDAPQELLAGITGPLPAAHVRSLGVSFSFFPDSPGNRASARELALFYGEAAGRKNGLGRSLLLKRTLDIVGSLTAIALFAPLFLVLPLLIKATSPGPVLFRQERIGRRGRTFPFLKFRSMAADNDPAIHREYIKQFIREQKSYDAGARKQDAVYKIKDDPRVTPIGRFLRKTSFDELPQFFNVLFGDMSLVGPRPPIPYELDNYDPWHRRRVMEIKPGITGLWQVSGRSRTTFDEMVRLDLAYAREWSLWLDVKIMLKTPWAVIGGKGAY
jgi:lipopolysaccharide/colanic/teichoic acid biosynthesis glycosyltransferase